MTDLSDGTRFWLGGQRGWSWSDGTPWDYENWAPGEPKWKGAEVCIENVALAWGKEKKGKWNDRGCNNNDDRHGDLGFACKK